LERSIPFIEKGLKEVFKDQANISPSLFKANYNPLAEAVASELGSIEYGKPNALFNHQFQHNTAVFAAFKTHKEQAELVKQLVDQDGNLRSFAEFQKNTKGILKDYNRNYLTAEYTTAVRAARMGEKWQAALKNADLFPNGEYMPSRSANPREPHKAFYNIIKPLTDPWWDTHLAPLDWNCLCGFRSTDKPATDTPDDMPEVITPFKNNPGKSAKMVDDEHPYYVGESNIIASATYQWLGRYMAPIQAKVITNSTGLYGAYAIGNKSFTVNKADLTKLVNQPVAFPLLRNTLIIGIKEFLKQAKLVKSIKGYKVYKLVYNGKPFYYNFKITADTLTLDSITERLIK